MTPKKPASTVNDDVLDPINMARARHATHYTPQPYAASGSGSARQAAHAGQQLTAEKNGCMFMGVVGMVFIIGSIMGGFIGAGLILILGGANNSALVSNAPLVTTVPSPTPAPAATLTPTPTLPVVVTPAIEEVILTTTQAVVTVINKHDEAYFYDDEGRVVGSGVIIDARGYIATNNHVVKNPGELSIVLHDGREVEAQLIAAKADQDLAVLKVNLINLPVVRWADSTQVRPGQVVYALGSPLGDFPNSVSFGIVSGLNRALEMDGHVIDNLIQTDAAINRGSSGGPLINSQGEVVGLNTFIIRESEERGIAEGIAFAIPAHQAQRILQPWVVAHSAEAEAIPAGN